MFCSCVLLVTRNKEGYWHFLFVLETPTLILFGALHSVYGKPCLRERIFLGTLFLVFSVIERTFRRIGIGTITVCDFCGFLKNVIKQCSRFDCRSFEPKGASVDRVIIVISYFSEFRLNRRRDDKTARELSWILEHCRQTFCSENTTQIAKANKNQVAFDTFPTFKKTVNNGRFTFACSNDYFETVFETIRFLIRLTAWFSVPVPCPTARTSRSDFWTKLTANKVTVYRVEWPPTIGP